MQVNTFSEAAKLANAAGMDAANRSMKAVGRISWNEEDQDAAFNVMETMMDALGFGQDKYPIRLLHDPVVNPPIRSGSTIASCRPTTNENQLDFQ